MGDKLNFSDEQKQMAIDKKIEELNNHNNLDKEPLDSKCDGKTNCFYQNALYKIMDIFDSYIPNSSSSCFKTRTEYKKIHSELNDEKAREFDVFIKKELESNLFKYCSIITNFRRSNFFKKTPIILNNEAIIFKLATEAYLIREKPDYQFNHSLYDTQIVMEILNKLVEYHEIIPEFDELLKFMNPIILEYTNSDLK